MLVQKRGFLLDNYFKKESQNNISYCNVTTFKNALVNCNCSMKLEEISSIVEYFCEKNEEGLINY